MNRMMSLRLLLVFTIAMCADKNLAMKISNKNLPLKEGEKFPIVQKLSTSKLYILNVVWFVQSFMFLRFRGPRERCIWGWESCWKGSGYSLIFLPNIYKNKWLKIGCLDFYFDYINFGIYCILSTLKDKKKKWVSKDLKTYLETWNYYWLVVGRKGNIYVLFFDFFNFLSIKILPVWNVCECFYYLLYLCRVVKQRLSERWDFWEKKKINLLWVFLVPKIQIDFNGLFNLFYKEETELDL